MERYKVIDDYFPQWMIDSVSYYLKTYPVTYDNTPNDTFDKARFLGNTLLMQDRWNVMGYERYWFIDYFNMCIQHDILKELNISHCARCLLNGQFPNCGMNGLNHDDSDTDDYQSVIYMAHGNSGDTVILNEDNTENRISFKEGRIVTFNSRIIHRGESPIEGYRISLGFVYPLFDPDNCKHY